ncbi:DNA-binding response OmpR family regulator [Deinobacterium chartae]|uniref:DNA-binding response OmpR family regulator n=1 Tax=Deinobacterium chartae TaxID=521158 RepID=A0A841I172_9DEIO|nr:response regulator transcription factor [Deinobacterium chartae]MBB6098826.1 DNA-binding response OmpR family regulator [Deinobacterium chartae]
MRILLMEDDAGIRTPLARYLRESGFAVDEAASASEAHGLYELYPYAALVADVRLPEGENAGFELVRELRAHRSGVPVLFLSARDTLEDRLEGLEAGGDDYLVKPFHLQEVAARLRALLRRGTQVTPDTVVHGELQFDWSRRRVTRAGQEVHLTGKELGLLELLSTHPGRLFTREEIIDRVWDASFDAETNVIDVYVRNLRRKLGDGVIETVRGVGYRFPS